MKKILIISTGGTISQRHTDQGVAVSNSNAFRGDTFADVLNSLIEELEIEKIDSITVINKDSSNMISKDWEVITQTIYDKYDDYDAFIVTHGTNTMGYTCAAVSFALGNLGKPVIFTGSQVSYGILGTDSVLNLENIVRVLCENDRLAGVLLIFGSKVISGTRVKKKTEFDYDAFKTFGRSPDIGYLGNKVVFNQEMLNKHMSFLGIKSRSRAGLDLKNKFDNNIISLTEFPGLKSEFIISLVESGVKGFILRATGAGDPNVAPEDATYPNLRDAFLYLQEHRIPIVVTTQAPDGVSSMSINNPGILAKELGAIPAWDMSMETMVTKLSWLIANGYQYEEIQELMVTSFRGEIDR